MTMTMSDFEHHPFWIFSLDVYRQKGIKEACLTLQDRCGININILLFCCWMAASGLGRLSRDELFVVMSAIQKWHGDITLGLRKLRVTLSKKNTKESLKSLRKAVLADELLAEQVEQMILANTLKYGKTSIAPAKERLADAKINLTTYIKLLNRLCSDADYQLISQVLAAAFRKIV